MTSSARAWAERMEAAASPLGGPDERFIGYGVMGLPFAGGHYLVLRRWPSNPFERPYSSVWHRTPDGHWTFYVDAAANASCPRYADVAIDEAVFSAIEVGWDGPARLTVRVADWVTWTMVLGSSTATAVLSAVAGVLPAAALSNRAVLAAMGAAAGPMLGAGRIRMAGTSPNGQWFTTEPSRVWTITDSTATVEGADLGAPGRLPEQAMLGEVPLPQRGLFWAGDARLERFDPLKHRAPRPAVVRAR